MKKRFRARFRWSIGAGAPDSHSREVVDSGDRPVVDTAARISAALDRGMRISLVVSAVIVFVVAVLILATMDAASTSQGGRVYVAIAAILILGAIYGAYERLEHRRRPFWMEGAGEAAYRRFLYRSIALLLAAAVGLIALSIFLP